VHPELQKVEAEVDRTDEQRLDFTKKQSPSTLEHYHSEKDIFYRNGSMKSIDNSQIRMEQHSPRLQQPILNTSNDKFKVFVPQNSHLSHFSPSPSQLNPRGSEIINISRNSENNSSPASKLIAARSVPQIDNSHHQHQRSSN
jgi:hypothetical protein